MSFLSRTTPAIRPAARAFSNSVRRPNVVDEAKGTLKKVDRSVSDAAVKGIEVGQEATQTAKEKIGMGAKKAEGTASEVAGEAKGKAAEVKGEAKGKAEEIKGKVS